MRNNEISNQNKLSLSWQEFENECAKVLKNYILLKWGKSDLKLCKRLYNKGYSVSDTISFMILKK